MIQHDFGKYRRLIDLILIERGFAFIVPTSTIINKALAFLRTIRSVNCSASVVSISYLFKSPMKFESSRLVEDVFRVIQFPPTIKLTLYIYIYKNVC